MSLAVVRSRAPASGRAPEVTVEVHLANGLPSFSIVGATGAGKSMSMLAARLPGLLPARLELAEEFFEAFPAQL
ncbi:hypothetical protein AB1286_09835 [Trinickia sp. NRRL B-1857]|uniref:hypothetical protein n=1 Tax=Trinickia sp. NRRL B-1857 TaxID=3162879 RepID=UPI003D286D23